MPFGRCRALLATCAVIAVTAACGSSNDAVAAPDDRLTIVATTTVLGDIVGNVAGNAAAVEVLMQPGADPHGFEASPQQAALLRKADLVVANGLGLEETLTTVLDAAEVDGAHILTVADKVDPIPFGYGDHEAEGAGGRESGEEPEHGSDDPHFWMDPVRVGEAVDLLADAFMQMDDATDWAAHGEAYAADLQDVHSEITGLVAQIPKSQRKLVTNHEALGYFVDRYGFEQVGAVIPGGTTLAEPGSAELVELAATIRREGVRAIFAESTQPDQLAQAVAAEVGTDIAVVELFTDSLGDGPEGATYVDMMRTNAQRISDALTGGSS